MIAASNAFAPLAKQVYFYLMNQNYAHYAEILQKHLPELRKQFGVKSLGLFGSYVRGQQQANSDLDILVNFDELPSLIKFIHLEDRLSEFVPV